MNHYNFYAGAFISTALGAAFHSPITGLAFVTVFSMLNVVCDIRKTGSKFTLRTHGLTLIGATVGVVFCSWMLGI